MRCVVIRDGELRLEERATPVATGSDVLVEVRSAGLNAADLLQRRGLYPAPEGWPPDVPGMELAGLVVGVGADVHEPLLGRRVCALVGGGAQATHCVVPHEHLLFVPDHVSWEDAGGFAEAFATAHDALVTQGDLRAGDRVLISGASGGVGVAAVQIAHAMGAVVVAVTRDNTHHDALRQLGADETVNVDELDDVEPVDLILELIGAAHLERALARVGPHGRVVVIGLGGGARAAIDLSLLMTRRLTLTGSTLRSRTRDEKARVIERVGQALVPRWRTGEIHVPLARVFDVDDVTDAYHYFAQPGKLGKVVLRLSE